MEAEMTTFLERIASGIEKLAEDPVIHVESGPAVCPFCEKMNPEIRIREVDGVGPLAEYLLQAECQQCHEIFYAIPQMWLCVKTQDEVEKEMENRRESYGNQG